MAEQENVIGIDLGTTFSAVAHVDFSGTPQIIPNLDNDRTTPSVVYIQDGTAVVGRIAREMASANPEHVIQFIKPHMGRRRKRFSVDGQEWTPEEISAIILRKVVVDAGASISSANPMRGAVITVPAFFNEQQRKSTADAGRIAGLDVLGIINEPTAAALAYGYHQLGKDQTILVYDLGGGTFDITIMRIEGNEIKMLATDGDVQLGGKDWDQRIIDHVAGEFAKKHGADPREHPESLQELIIHAEQAKIRLVKLPETKIVINCGGARENIPLSRELFDELTHDLVSQTEMTLRLTIEDAGLDIDEIDECLLVGGSTRLKSVQSMFERLIGKGPRHILNPDECVAQGASIHAVMQQLRPTDGQFPTSVPNIDPGKLDRFRVIEERLINAHTLGIKALAADGKAVVAPVIPRASHIPCRVVKSYETSRTGQDVVRISVMEGESPNPEACTEIGTCFVRGLPENLAKGSPIEVCFEYSQDSRLNVTATLPTVQESAQTDIQRASGMTDDEIQVAVERVAQLKIE